MMPTSEHHQSVADTLVNRFKQKVSNSYWRDIFDKYDVDKDGLISYDELKHIIESSPVTAPEDTALVMKVSDTDSSGNLDFEEFKTMMRNPAFSHLFEHYYTKYVDYIVPPRDIGFQPVPSDDREKALFHASSEPGAQSPPPLGWVVTTDLVFKDRTYEQKFKCIFWPPALCMTLLSALQIGLFFYDFPRYEEDHFSDGPTAKILMYNRNKREQAWRYITYMLVHGSFMHLFENVLIQMILGIMLGFRQRWWRVAIIYLAGVAAGSLAASVIEPDRNLAGASAGNYALFTAHTAIIIMNWSKMGRPYIQLMVFLILGIMNITYMVIMYEENNSVSYTAHAGGSIAGLLVGIFVLRNLKQRKCEKHLWWAALSVYVCLMLTAILSHIFLPRHFDQTPLEPCDNNSLASCSFKTSGYLRN